MTKPSKPQAEWLDFAFKAFTAPGNGVYTVHTGSDKRRKLMHALYQCDEDQFLEKWKASLAQFATLSNDPRICMYGIPSDSGGGIQRGANWGPLAIREYLYTQEWSQAFSHHFFDLGDVRVNPQLLMDEYLNEKTIRACRKAMYGDEASKLPVSPLNIAGEFLAHFLKANPTKKLFMLGGDHSVSYPAVREFLRAKHANGKNPGVLHFDAHTDLLDARLGIDICFGSWVSHVLGELKDPSQFVQIGIRASGKQKEHWQNVKGVRQFWADEVNRDSKTVANAILAQLKAQKVDTLYVSFDIDGLDISEASATGTPERGGLKTKDCIEILDLVGKEVEIEGADLTEVAPYVRHPNGNENEPEVTLKHAVQVIHAISDLMI